MLDKRSIERNCSQDHCIGRLNNGPIIIESVPRVTNTSLGALLQLTREIAVRLDSRFWYRQVVWGRFVRSGVGCMITMPVISREFWLGHLGIPLAELMFPEYLKGKLSLDEWRILIEMHLLRLKAFNSGRMSRLLGMMGLMILGALAALLIVFYIFVGRPWGPILVFPALGAAILLSLLWVGRSLRTWEFELDGNAASQFGIEQVTQVLEKMQGLDPEGDTVEPRRSVFGVLDPEHRQADGGVEGQAVCRSSKTVSNAEDRLPRTGNHHCSGSGYFLGLRGSRWQPLR